MIILLTVNTPLCFTLLWQNTAYCSTSPTERTAGIIVPWIATNFWGRQPKCNKSTAGQPLNQGFFLFALHTSTINIQGEETCFSLCWGLPADSVPLDGPDRDSVAGPGPQSRQPVGGGVGPHWDLPSRGRGGGGGGVGQHVAVDRGLGTVPDHAEGGLRFISGQEVRGSVQVWRRRVMGVSEGRPRHAVPHQGQRNRVVTGENLHGKRKWKWVEGAVAKV